CGGRASRLFRTSLRSLSSRTFLREKISVVVTKVFPFRYLQCGKWIIEQYAVYKRPSLVMNESCTVLSCSKGPTISLIVSAQTFLESSDIKLSNVLFSSSYSSNCKTPVAPLFIFSIR